MNQMVLIICVLLIGGAPLFAQLQKNNEYNRHYIYINAGGYNIQGGLNYETQILKHRAKGIHLVTGVGFADSQTTTGWYKFSSVNIGLNYISRGFIAFEGGIMAMPYFLENAISDLPGAQENGIYGILNAGIRIKPNFRNGLFLRAAWNPIIGKDGVFLEWGSLGIGYSFKTRHSM